MAKLSRWFAGVGLGGAALLVALPASAADLAYPPYPGEAPGPDRDYREERVEEAPPPRFVHEPRFAHEPGFAAGPYAAPPLETCRIVVKRRIDEDGVEIERSIRICDGPGYPHGPRFRPSFFRPPPPPADVPYEGYAGPPRW